MPVFRFALPLAIPMLGIRASALPVRADGISVRSVFGDDEEYGSDSERFRTARRDFDDWRRRSGDHGDSDADQARGLAARELLEAIEDGVNEGRWIPIRKRKTRGQEILATLEQSLPEEAASAAGPAEPSLRSRIRLHLARGLEYCQELDIAERPLKLRLYGPIVSGSPALGFQLRGRVSEHAFDSHAFGSSDEVGLEIEIGF